MGRVIGITGTPGTGKKTIAPLVASKLGLPCHSLNELSVGYGGRWGTDTESDVDTRALARKLSRRLREPSLLYGHLLPYVLNNASIACAVVLRCEPSVLRSRLIARGYRYEKIAQNVEAELIGLVASDAQTSFGREKTMEFDTTTSEPMAAAQSISRMVRRRSHRQSRIDWTLRYDSPSRLRSLLPGRGTGSALT